MDGITYTRNNTSKPFGTFSYRPRVSGSTKEALHDWLTPKRRKNRAPAPRGSKVCLGLFVFPGAADKAAVVVSP